MTEPPSSRRGSAAERQSADGPPAGYTFQRERDVLIVALPSAIATVTAAIAAHRTLYQWAAQSAGAAAYRGRGAAYRVQVATDMWLVRHYRRGGMVARISEDVYVNFGEVRPLRELHASVAARAAGVLTPQVIAAVVYHHGITYRADLATRFVPDSIDLAAVTFGPARWAPAARSAAWRAAGTLLRRAFDAGVQHPDLNLRNVLIESRAESVQAWLLDLDRANVGVMRDVARQTMLDRFHRSRRKLESQAGEVVGAAELAAFDAALHGTEDR